MPDSIQLSLPFPVIGIYNWWRVWSAGSEVREIKLMPIFEFLCKGCGKQFEVLIRGSEKPHCPKCNGTRLEQQLSAFAVAAGHGNGGSTEFASGPAPGCGSCGMGGGSCALDDD